MRNKNGTFEKGNTVWKGRKHKSETIEKMKKIQRKVAYWKGKKLPENVKEKLRLAKLGNKHWNWQGGITKESSKIRNTGKLREWRRLVFEKDGKKCVLCKREKIKLYADHIKSFAQYPELRFVVNNGRVLCYQCHKQTPNFAGKNHQTKTSR